MAKKSQPPTVDPNALRLDLKTVATIVMVVLSAAAAYYGVKARVDALGAQIDSQQRVIERLNTALDAQGKVLVELSVSIRLHGLSGK